MSLLTHTRIPITSSSCLNGFHVSFQSDLSLAVQSRISQLPAEYLYRNSLVLFLKQKRRLLTPSFSFPVFTSVFPTFYISGDGFSSWCRDLKPWHHLWFLMPILIIQGLQIYKMSLNFISLPCLLFVYNRILNHYWEDAAVVYWLNLMDHLHVFPSLLNNVALTTLQSVSAIPSFSWTSAPPPNS